MTTSFYSQIQTQLEQVKADGLYKSERVITSAQNAKIKVAEKKLLISVQITIWGWLTILN